MGMAGKQVPISGGGYLRLYPYQFTERYVDMRNQKGMPAMVYFHPWELDTRQKRLKVGMMKGFQHYVTLDSTEYKLNRLLERFHFTSIQENLESKRVQSLLRKNPVRVEAIQGGWGMHPLGPALPEPTAQA
jgi:hypothetical protein